jgi:hypothetical protein
MRTNIHAALNAAMRDVAKIGIAKTKTADTGMAKYQFRGVEQAMNELSPILVNNGITVTPRYSDLTINERAKGDPKDGKATRFVTLKGSFIFTALDGSSVTSEAYGEAMDSGDKAVIKAQSVSFRTALFQLFVVPTMSMDTELDDYEGAAGGDDLLTSFREAALGGSKALKAYFDEHKPSEAFWSRHSASLKQAAAEADKAARQ